MDLKKKTITVDEERWQLLDEYARQIGINRLQLIRMMIEHTLKTEPANFMAQLIAFKNDKKSA